MAPFARRSIQFLAIVFAAYVLLELMAGLDFARWLFYARILDAGISFVLVALIAVAIARYKLFDINVRVRLAVHRGTLLMIFSAVGFAAAESVANWLGNAQGVLVGAAAAAILFFFLQPLQRVAERVSRTVVPKGDAPDRLSHEEQLALFREQAELAWLDGVMKRKERLLLDSLRDRLRIPLPDAARIESEVLGTRPPMERRRVRRQTSGSG